jgi:hypothetical protein
MTKKGKQLQRQQQIPPLRCGMKKKRRPRKGKGDGLVTKEQQQGTKEQRQGKGGAPRVMRRND